MPTQWLNQSPHAWVPVAAAARRILMVTPVALGPVPVPPPVQTLKQVKTEWLNWVMFNFNVEFVIYTCSTTCTRLVTVCIYSSHSICICCLESWPASERFVFSWFIHSLAILACTQHLCMHVHTVSPAVLLWTLIPCALSSWIDMLNWAVLW